MPPSACYVTAVAAGVFGVEGNSNAVSKSARANHDQSGHRQTDVAHATVRPPQPSTAELASSPSVASPSPLILRSVKDWWRWRSRGRAAHSDESLSYGGRLSRATTPTGPAYQYQALPAHRPPEISTTTIDSAAGDEEGDTHKPSCTRL